MRLLITLCLGLLFTGAASAREFAIDHLEPASWWVGMKHNRVELMVHGADVATLAPRLAHPGVSIAGVAKVENPNYLFVTLAIAGDAKPGTFAIEFLDGTTVAVRHPYRLDAREPGSAMRRGFDTGDAIYLITPDRFANGDPGNDSVAAMTEPANRTNANGRHGGDIAGIRKHLDYIAGMGFTQIWSTPLLENNQPEYSYHGYAITDLYRTDPRFGSNEDYRALSQEARRRGIGLIMDVVLNHVGSRHWWMADPPARDWFNRFEGAGLDGVIAKRADLTYQPDKRVMAKIKHVRTADCVVAGYRVHKSAPDAIGSLLLGLHIDAAAPRSQWGDHTAGLAPVGVIGAFGMARRRELFAELQSLVVDVADHPWSWAAEAGHAPEGGSRWNPKKDLSFVPLRPERVVEVRYDYLEGARFRHPPQFVRWRPDRDPASCGYAQLEQPAPFDVSGVLSTPRRAPRTGTP